MQEPENVKKYLLIGMNELMNDIYIYIYIIHSFIPINKYFLTYIYIYIYLWVYFDI